jgi:hypothetical protein
VPDLLFAHCGVVVDMRARVLTMEKLNCRSMQDWQGTMDLSSVYSYLEEESRTGPLLVYVAVGCAVGRYPEGEHPQQQYPPYLQTFDCRQICVLIDPDLEMPPRSMADTAELATDITILPVLESLYHSVDHDGFLDRVAQLCLTTQNRLIVQEFNGSNTNLHYPMHLGREVRKYVLYDPTYSDGGGCSPNLSAIELLRDARGNFVQPQHARLQDLYGTVPAEIFKKQFKSRFYHVVQILLRKYRIVRNLEEPRDWVTDTMVSTAMQQFCFIYDLPVDGSLQALLLAVVQDFCALGQTQMSLEEMRTIVESPGNEMETLWGLTGSLLGF